MADSKTFNRGETGSNATGSSRSLIETTTERVRQRAAGVADASSKAVDQAPLGSVASALAFGAVAAALIPATAREISTIGPLGAKLRGLLDEAFKAARTAGLEHLSTKGLAGAALTSGIGQNIGHLVSAALAASTAASTTVRQRQGGRGSGTDSRQAAEASTPTGGDTATASASETTPAQA